MSVDLLDDLIVMDFRKSFRGTDGRRFVAMISDDPFCPPLSRSVVQMLIVPSQQVLTFVRSRNRPVDRVRFGFQWQRRIGSTNLANSSIALSKGTRLSVSFSETLQLEQREFVVHDLRNPQIEVGSTSRSPCLGDLLTRGLDPAPESTVPKPARLPGRCLDRIRGPFHRGEETRIRPSLTKTRGVAARTPLTVQPPLASGRFDSVTPGL